MIVAASAATILVWLYFLQNNKSHVPVLSLPSAAKATIYSNDLFGISKDRKVVLNLEEVKVLWKYVEPHSVFDRSITDIQYPIVAVVKYIIGDRDHAVYIRWTGVNPSQPRYCFDRQSVILLDSTRQRR